METVAELHANAVRVSRMRGTAGHLYVLDEWDPNEGGRWVCRWLNDNYSEFLYAHQIMRQSRPFWLKEGVVLRTRFYGNVMVQRMTTRDNPPHGTVPTFTPRQVGFPGEMVIKGGLDWFAQSVAQFEELNAWKKSNGSPQ